MLYLIANDSDYSLLLQGVGFAMNPPRFLKPGDSVHVEIENIGILKNPVTAAAAL